MSSILHNAFNLNKNTRERGRRIREAREKAEREAAQKGQHILDFQWAVRRDYGLDDPAIFWHRGYGYYCGVGHDDGEVKKLDHMARTPDDMIIDINFSPYCVMRYDEFAEAVDELIRNKKN